MRWIALSGWCAFLFFYGLSGPLYRTEALRAIIGRSAMEGAWYVPTLYGEPFLTKPPGCYAAIALVSSPLGEVTERSARLPSAIAATFAVFCVFATFRRFLGERSAFIIALMLPVSFLWLDKAPSAEIDMLQLAWVTLAICCFLRGYDRKESGRSAFGWWAVALLAVAGGSLTKWTAPAFFYLTIGTFLVWRGRWRWLFSPEHLLGVVLAGTVCVGWAAAVSDQVGWDVLRDTVGREGAQRFAPKTVGKPYPWSESLAFPAVMLGACLPWSIPALFTLRTKLRSTWNDGERTAMQLAHCWAWPNLIFWCLPAQHNVRYVLPMVAAITILGAFACFRDRGVNLRQPTRWVIGVVLVWAIAKVVFVEVIVPGRTAGRHAPETGEEIARLVPADQVLYISKLKDEGVMFYYGRPARRLKVDELPAQPYFALLIASEWAERDRLGRVELVAELKDQQQAPIYLVRVLASRDEVCPSPPTMKSFPSAP